MVTVDEFLGRVFGFVCLLTLGTGGTLFHNSYIVNMLSSVGVSGVWRCDDMSN